MTVFSQYLTREEACMPTFLFVSKIILTSIPHISLCAFLMCIFFYTDTILIFLNVSDLMFKKITCEQIMYGLLHTAADLICDQLQKKQI